MSGSYFTQRAVCPGCRSTDMRELYAAPFAGPPIRQYLECFYSTQGGVDFTCLEGAVFTLDECASCGLVFQREILNEAGMVKLYDEWIDPGRVLETVVSRHGREYYSRIASDIEACIDHFGCAPSALTMLDFGMGWGEWCRMAQAYGCTALGTEVSERRIRYAQRFGVIVVDMLEIGAGRFDFINTEQVLEHVADPLATLQGLAAALKPEGILKLHVPNGWDIKHRLAILDWEAPKGTATSLNVVAPLEHINCFREKSLLAMAELAGLERVALRPRAEPRRSIFDSSLRDLLRPCYRALVRRKPRAATGSTYLHLRRKAYSNTRELVGRANG